jgi:hypothetical protein
MGAQALIFLAGFLAILFAYIYLIRWLARRLENRIAAPRYTWVERLCIGGIVTGVVAMFQPWFFVGYKLGFLLLLLATLAFIAWSHVTPADIKLDQP